MSRVTRRRTDGRAGARRRGARSVSPAGEAQHSPNNNQQTSLVLMPHQDSSVSSLARVGDEIPRPDTGSIEDCELPVPRERATQLGNERVVMNWRHCPWDSLELPLVGVSKDFSVWLSHGRRAILSVNWAAKQSLADDGVIDLPGVRFAILLVDDAMQRLDPFIGGKWVVRGAVLVDLRGVGVQQAMPGMHATWPTAFFSRRF